MKHRRIQKSDRHKKIKSVQIPKENNFVKDAILRKNLEQSMPRKLKEILEAKNAKDNDSNNKSNNKTKRRKQILKEETIIVKPSVEQFEELQPGMTRKPKPLPEKMVKQSYESNYHFMNRLNRMVAQSIAEATLEEHFDVDLGEKIRSDNQDPVDSKAKREDEEESDKDLKAKKEKKREKNRQNLMRRKAKKLKKQKRLRKQLENFDDLNNKRRENIKFGEVVHCPPNLDHKNMLTKLKSKKNNK